MVQWSTELKCRKAEITGRFTGLGGESRWIYYDDCVALDPFTGPFILTGGWLFTFITYPRASFPFFFFFIFLYHSASASF